MTTTEPNAGGERRGRHAKREDDETPAAPPEKEAEPEEHTESAETAEPEDQAEPEEPAETADDEAHEEPPPAEPPPAAPARAEQPRDGAPPKPSRTRFRHSLPHHPAGASLLTAAGLVTGLTLAPLLFDQLNFEVATRGADAARSAAAPWPAGGQPWFWPGWMATTAAVVAIVVLVVAAVGLTLPDVAVLATAVVLAVTTARAAWATFAVLNAHLWELIPVVLVCLLAFGSAAAAVFRWRSPERAGSGAGAGEVAGVTIGSWLLVVLLILGGSAIASSAQTHAFGNVTSPPQNLAGLLSVRAADAPQLDNLRGHWVPQLGAAQVRDDAAATAYAVVHHGFTTQFATVLARGDDIGAADLDSTWWLSLADQAFGSQQEAAAWCSSSGVAGCTPRQLG